MACGRYSPPYSLSGSSDAVCHYHCCTATCFDVGVDAVVGCVRHGRRAVAASTSRQALPVQRDASAQQLSVQICRRETQRRPQHQGTFRLLQCSASYVSCQRATARICCCCAAAAGHPTPGSNRLVYLARRVLSSKPAARCCGGQ